MPIRFRLFALFLVLALTAPAKPNFLLLPIDDLNDWIGCLGGHPQAKTPNIDRLAARGVLFNNAHCQSPVCNPSRASLGVSLYPSTTGIYFLSPDISAAPAAKAIPTFPHHFQNQGYAVAGAGKPNGYTALLRLHPLLHALSCLADAVDGQENFQELALLNRAITEITADRMRNVFLVLDQDIFQFR